MSHNVVILNEYSYNRYSLAVLTGVLEEDERFQDLDIQFLKNNELNEKIPQFAKHYRKVVVGFSFHTPNVLAMASVISSIRETLEHNSIDNALLVGGGPHPSGDPLGTLEMGVDIVVVGEGETTFPSLLEKYFSDTDYNTLPGISFLENEQYHYTGRPVPIDLSDYAAFAPKHRRFCPIEISRGCPWACKFCQTPFLMGGRMRHRSIESIVKYASVAKGKGLSDLRFITPGSFAYGSSDGRTVQLDVLEDMLKAVNEVYSKNHIYLGSFPSEVRPENVTPETIDLVKVYCANDNIIIGAQSGSDSLLDSIHRGHGVEEVARAVKLAIEAGLVPNVDFIFGMPGETQEDINQTLAFMEELTQMGARIHSHAFIPLVGTPFYDTRPGEVHPRIRSFLKSMRGKGLEYGYWKKQEKYAEESSAFLAEQKTQRPKRLRKIVPFRPTKSK